MLKVIQSPFSQEQVSNLDDFQKANKFPPYKCHRDKHVLRAEARGLVCDKCGTVQPYAHNYAVSGAWRDLPTPSSGG